MKYFGLFVGVYLLVMLIYLITVIGNKRKLAVFPKSNQALILIKRFKLNINETNVKKFAIKIALSNSFIIAFTLTITELVNNFLLKLLIAFLVMIPLIIILYYLIGISMKKEGNKNV